MHAPLYAPVELKAHHHCNFFARQNRGQLKLSEVTAELAQFEADECLRAFVVHVGQIQIRQEFPYLHGKFFFLFGSGGDEYID